MTSRIKLVAYTLALSLSACGDNEGLPASLGGYTEGMLKVQKVEWNVRMTNVGKVFGVTEAYDDLAVFSDQGVQVFSSGVVFGGDTSVTNWASAMVLPAGDLSGDWAVGLAADGKVFRLKNRTNLEDVSDRYGLAGQKVLGAANLGKGLSGFVLDKSLAVADGKNVTRYDGAFLGLVGGGGRAVAVSGDRVRVFSPADRGLREYVVPSAVGAAFDPAGKLYVATPQTLFVEEGSDLRRVYGSSQPITGITGGTSGVWLALGDSLALISGQEVRRAQAGVVPGKGTLIPSPSGDVWVLASGALSRFEEDDGGGADKDLWRRNVLPMFGRLCAICHLPGGSAGIDLSTYTSWAQRRQLMDLRVVQGKPTPMPPAGAGKLTAEELSALNAWIKNK